MKTAFTAIKVVRLIRRPKEALFDGIRARRRTPPPLTPATLLFAPSPVVVVECPVGGLDVIGHAIHVCRGVKPNGSQAKRTTNFVILFPISLY